MSKVINCHYFSEERKLSVPIVICRICSENFFADKDEDHSKYCKDKVNKMKS